MYNALALWREERLYKEMKKDVGGREACECQRQGRPVMALD